MSEQPEALAEQGCDYCNHPQYAGTKCKNCGREQPAQQEPKIGCVNHDCDKCKAQQQQEPVAWLKVIETPGGWGKFVEAKPHEKGAKPVYTSPPNVPTAQPSKPLTDEQVHEGGRKTDPDGEDLCYWSFKQGVRFAEAAHGIKGDA